MPAVIGVLNATYTPISTAGTTTVNNAGPTPPAHPTIFFGFDVFAVGTAAVVLTALDVFVQGTATNTNTVYQGTASSAGVLSQPASGVGIRLRGSLVVVMSGTAGSVNALWD